MARGQNTQSGSQWDGLRHFGILDHGVYYNGYENVALAVSRGLV